MHSLMHHGRFILQGVTGCRRWAGSCRRPVTWRPLIRNLRGRRRSPRWSRPGDGRCPCLPGNSAGVRHNIPGWRRRRHQDGRIIGRESLRGPLSRAQPVRRICRRLQAVGARRPCPRSDSPPARRRIPGLRVRCTARVTRPVTPAARIRLAPPLHRRATIGGLRWPHRRAPSHRHRPFVRAATVAARPPGPSWWHAAARAVVSPATVCRAG